MMNDHCNFILKVPVGYMDIGPLAPKSKKKRKSFTVSPMGWVLQHTQTRQTNHAI